MTQTTVTTSWDDGHRLDMRIAALLTKYRLAGTFYVSPKDREFPADELLTATDIRLLAKQFEIGAHTMTHPRLTRVSQAEARSEIVASKRWLEEMIEQPVGSFCYPGGAYTSGHCDMAREAGFGLARTVKRFALAIGPDLYQLPTTVHAYRHYLDIRPILRMFGPRRFWHLYRNWDELAVALFDRAEQQDGVFHIWGHSWEIEQRGDWERLERVFAHIANRPDVRYIANGELA
ncbi:MAG TPA: polysaccharide deacetylase family protein [Candidatus Saccharimonadales bacterium]|nr:polysaccharide deacetylase family protein [Candidatus Saccharimonadales bacterium]